jgi:hypothetical protein
MENVKPVQIIQWLNKLVFNWTFSGGSGYSNKPNWQETWKEEFGRWY